MVKIAIISLLLSVGLMASEVRVAVAANLGDVIEVLKKEFALAHPNTKISSVLGSSGKLSAQIINGAPFDIFLSANMTFPENLYIDKVALTKPVVYASGALAIMSTRGLDLSKGMEVMTNASVSKIALANPKTAPYGVASIEVLKNAKLYDAVASKLVFGESISQTVQFATTATEIGLVNKSVFYSDKMKHFKEGKDWVDVDPKLYNPIEQGMVLLVGATHNADAQKFYDFILSAPAKKIFKDYGYLVNE